MSKERLPWVLLFGLVLAVGFVQAPVWAHEGHKHGSPEPSPTPEMTEPAKAEAPVPQTSPTPVPLADVSLREAVFEHLHNKIVHFPLALGCAAALLLLLSYRWEEYWPAARLLLLLSAIGAAAAYFSGQAQAEDLVKGPLREYFERHEALGTTSAVTLWMGWALTFAPKARRWLWLYALLIMGLLAATGFVGGILSHASI